MAALPAERHLNIVLLGRTGRGKSATANSIVDCADAFRSKRGPTAVTVCCEMRSRTMTMPRVPSGDPDAADQQPSVQVNVVDTPGLFDPGLSNAETVAEIGRALSLVPGPSITAAFDGVKQPPPPRGEEGHTERVNSRIDEEHTEIRMRKHTL